MVALDLAQDDEIQIWLKQLAHQNHHNIMYRKMDVTNFAECKNVIDEIWGEFSRIDALINNAGITRDAVFHKMTEAQWNAVLRVNLDGMFNATRNVVEYMREQEEGRIINISSVSNINGVPGII